MNDETLFEFPTAFPIKVMGRESPEFRQLVISLIAEHAAFDAQQDVSVQLSKNGTFASVTIEFEATSREQLDTVYQTLHDHEDILLVF